MADDNLVQQALSLQQQSSSLLQQSLGQTPSQPSPVPQPVTVTGKVTLLAPADPMGFNQLIRIHDVTGTAANADWPADAPATVSSANLEQWPFIQVGAIISATFTPSGSQWAITDAKVLTPAPPPYITVTGTIMTGQGYSDGEYKVTVTGDDGAIYNWDFYPKPSEFSQQTGQTEPQLLVGHHGTFQVIVKSGHAAYDTLVSAT